MPHIPLRDPVKVPGPIAPALITGRPELARLGMQPIIEQAKGTPLEQLAKDLVDFAAATVQDIENERAVMRALLPGVEAARSNISGALGAIDRLELALKEIQAGADPEYIMEDLKSNSARTRERKALARKERE